MLYTSSDGRDRTIKPKGPDYVFAIVVGDGGVTASGIILEAHRDFPRTQGYICELSAEYDGPLRMDDHILFNRYADDFVVEDCYEDKRDRIYTLHTGDIIATLELQA